MGVLRKADFYYGSMLSYFINNGLAPAIIEPGDNRRIYTLYRLGTKNGIKNGMYEIYAKYVSAPSRNRKNDTKLWQFNFSPDEVNLIRNYKKDLPLYFVLICGREELQDSELALLTLDEVKDCLDVHTDRDSYRITVRWEKGIHGLKVYGSGRPESISGRDNTIRISRDLLSYFKEDIDETGDN